MQRPPSIAALLAATAILLSGTNAAHADYPSDVEGARMNARAGGPTNDHDAELLKRWGATTTSRSHHARAYRAEQKTTKPQRARDDR